MKRGSLVMVVPLVVVLGVAVITLGAVVLLRFPDRPGGAIRFQGMEVSSKGAGLPLIVLGAALAVAAVTVVPGAIHDTGESSGGGESGVSGLAVAPQTDCTRTYFAQRPPVDSSRVRSVELDAQDRRVLGVGEPQDTEFGLVFSDTCRRRCRRCLAR